MSFGRSGPSVRSGFLETPRTRFGGVFLASAQTASQVVVSRHADLVPLPRKHRHRYHGVFAPNHRLRKAVTSLAMGNVGKRDPAATGGQAVSGHAAERCCDANQKSRSHDTSRIAWSRLMARVGEEYPLECPNCGGDIRLIAFITDQGPIRKILTPPRRTARTAASFAGPWSADRLGRARAGPRRPGNLSGDGALHHLLARIRPALVKIGDFPCGDAQPPLDRHGIPAIPMAKGMVAG